MTVTNEVSLHKALQQATFLPWSWQQPLFLPLLPPPHLYWASCSLKWKRLRQKKKTGRIAHWIQCATSWRRSLSTQENICFITVEPNDNFKKKHSDICLVNVKSIKKKENWWAVPALSRTAPHWLNGLRRVYIDLELHWKPSSVVNGDQWQAVQMMVLIIPGVEFCLHLIMHF